MSLVINDLRKSYVQGDERLEILKGLSVTLPEGAIVAIVGRSGSGKSTLLAMLAGLERPDGGTIHVDGKEITQLSEKEITAFRARNISLVFQQYHLVSHLTALENVTLPLEILQRPDADAKAEKLLTDLGLGHRLKHVPGKLSGGEAQRVALARALIVEPKLLLADEPSGNLDTDTGDHVMDLFFETVRRQKVTTVLVTHSESLAKRCDRVLRLEHGALRES